jgi:hypothetical protein
MMKNLLVNRYHMSTLKERKAGLDWYVGANDLCYKLAAKYNTTPMKVAGIIAALSPNNKWERNQLDADNFLATKGKCKVCTFNANKVKAQRIMDLPDCLPYAITHILKGPKTSAFFWNIFKPLDSGYVTLDRWALRAVEASENPKVGERREAIQAYEDAARYLGVRNHELQAIVWEQIRNEG